MGKTVPLRLLGFLMQVVNLPGLSVLTSVHVRLEFCSFEPDSYTLLWENKVLSSSVVCQSVCKCIMDVHVPQSSPELNLTLQSYKQEQMSEARFFQLIPLQSSFLKVVVSTTSAVLNWTDWTSEQIQHVCVGAQCWTLDSSQPSCLVSGLQHGTRYMVTVEQKTWVPQVNVTLTQKLQLAIET
ncbi:phosphatidylinositol phosphatase PTPRQ isoform X1, partial [Tachysurus ichikawai]